MKSKKIIALALTAAIAISAASMTAFAKTVTYNTDSPTKNPENKIATVVLTGNESIVKTEKQPKSYKAKEDFSTTAKSYAKGASITADEYKTLTSYADKIEVDEWDDVKYVEFGDLGLSNYTRTITKRQFGWVKLSADTDAVAKESAMATAKEEVKNPQWTQDKDPSLKDKVYVSNDRLYLDKDFAKNADDEYELKFLVVGRTDTDDDNIKENQKAIDAAESKDKVAKNRKEELEKLDKENNATDNYDAGVGKGVTTEPAKVFYYGSARSSKGDADENHPSWTANWDDAAHDLSVAGLNLDKNNLAWVYNVEAPDRLINGKNARATLDLPDGYTTSGYKAAVYHIKGWCSAEKVKGVNVGTNDVTFWANDFSPYVLVLTPRDAVAGTSTGNPSTGDFSAVPVAMLAAAALGATGFVAYKKRKAE